MGPLSLKLKDLGQDSLLQQFSSGLLQAPTADRHGSNPGAQDPIARRTAEQAAYIDNGHPNARSSRIHTRGKVIRNLLPRSLQSSEFTGKNPAKTHPGMGMALEPQAIFGDGPPHGSQGATSIGGQGHGAMGGNVSG
jgi:hypothetical protein